MPDPTDIANWLRISDCLTTSGQPREDQIGTLAAMGIEHVINLALHTHELALPDEAAAVAACGMNYVHIPVAFDAPTEMDFDRFCAALTAIGNDPVHVHCIVNARVSAFVYRYRRDVLGVDERLARAAMKRIWRPGGVWAAFIGDDDAVALRHRSGRTIR